MTLTSWGIILFLWSHHFGQPYDGCSNNPSHLGWQVPGGGWQGGEYGRPRCVASNGTLVYCDEYCPSKPKLNHKNESKQ